MGLNDTISVAVQKSVPKVGYEDSLRAAIEEMDRSSVSALAVESGGELVGIITEMDLMNSLVQNDDLDASKVNQCMTACDLISSAPSKISPCIQLDEDESVMNALKVMNEAGVRNLLVSGGDDKAIGLVSARDLLKIATA